MTTLKLTSFAAASVLTAATAFAQAHSGPSIPNQVEGSAASRVTMTGCLERADQLNSSGGSNGGTSVDSQSFVLVRAEVLSPSAGTAGTPAAAAGTAPPPTAAGGTPTAMAGGAAANAMYRLDAAADKLNPHVGHKVEVVGTRVALPAGAAATQPDAKNPTAATAPTLRVESVKMVASSCGR